MVSKVVARLVALLALAAVAVGTYLIVHNGLATHHHAKAGKPAAVLTGPGKLRHRRNVRTPRFYVVRQGETLSAIAVRTHLPLSQLLSLNPQVSANSLQTGERLRLRR